MAPSRPLMRGIRPPRVFSTRGGRVSPYAAALLVASAFLLALIAFGVFSLPVSAPNAATAGAGAGGGEAESADARPARPRARRDLAQGLGERGAQWTEVISWEPRAFVYHNFLSKEECEYLIRLAKPHMVKSTVVDDTTGKSKDDSRVRTSSGMFLLRGRDKVIRAIEKRIADYTFIPVEHGEGLQVLHYEVGQKYEPHFDYFLDEYNTKDGGQRMATMLMYLSDVEEGGETIFPDANVNSSSLPYNELSECARKGLAIKPKMGDALLFWSMKPDATLDPLSLHGGCPVISGNKWSSTKWMHTHEIKD
ncbi:hypothetical protein ACP70R_028076 [Stipagrostis hirtigluma subsp. patula]